MLNETFFFASSLDLREHPLISEKEGWKKKYYTSLEELVRRQSNNRHTEARLEQYRYLFFGASDRIQDDDAKKTLRKLVRSRFQPWHRKYRYFLVSDIALILMDKKLIQSALEDLMGYLSEAQKKRFQQFLLNWEQGMSKGKFLNDNFMKQYRFNQQFLHRPLRKFIVTANMSAGKSTLINALTGKKLVRTSQQVCTGNACYIYNKPFEDDRVHLENQLYCLDANSKDLSSVVWNQRIQIASYFNGISSHEERFCIIDTPGVNSTLHEDHAEITHKTLQEEEYEKVIYVLGANQLGTDEEMAHIKWISDHLPKEKVIFVLNKLDGFNPKEDNIETSIESVRRDLKAFGFDNPILCPMSAYFGYLIKKKIEGAEMSDDELDEFDYYVRKFKKPMFDLSVYYENVKMQDTDDELTLLGKKCGLYGLEKILMGGAI